MKTAVYENYKLTRYEGKGFLRYLNIRTHRDVAGLPDACLPVGRDFLSGLSDLPDYVIQAGDQCGG